MTRPQLRDALAIAAITAQGIFAVSWIVGGLIQSGYSADAQYISELAGSFAQHPWIVEAGIAIWGLGFIALAGAVRLGVAPGRTRTWIVGLLVAMGLAGVCTAFLQLDCSTSTSVACRRASQAGDLSWHHYAHSWLAFAAQVMPVAIALLVARLLWPRGIAWIPIGGAAFGIAVVLGGLVANSHSPSALPSPAGLVQRLSFLALSGGVVLLALVLMAPRPVLPANRA